MNSSFLTSFITLIKKEFLLGARTLESVISVLFFTFLVVLVFHFGFAFLDSNIFPFIPSFIWLATLFGGMLRLNQTFEPENEGKVLDGMRQIPDIAIPFFLSKFIFNLVFVLVLEIFTFVMLIILFNIPAPLTYLAHNWLPFFLGAVGLSCIGTVFSNMVISHNRREIILSVISYPILIPLIIGVLKSFVFNVNGEIIELDMSWIKILAIFDIVYLMLSVMVFDTLLRA